MTDDGFVFGDDADDDETALFGVSSAESDTETDQRFGTTTIGDTDSRSFSQRIRGVVSSGSVRTAATAGLAVVLVVALGLVAYPLVMDALDAPDPAGEADMPAAGSAGVGTHATATHETPATATVTSVQTATPTPTAPASTMADSMIRKMPTTPTPTQAFPAGTPVETNETTDARRTRSVVQSAA
jgi:carbohydrate-binding DOMON domain-containing protein